METASRLASPLYIGLIPALNLNHPGPRASPDNPALMRKKLKLIVGSSSQASRVELTLPAALNSMPIVPYALITLWHNWMDLVSLTGNQKGDDYPLVPQAFERITVHLASTSTARHKEIKLGLNPTKVALPSGLAQGLCLIGRVLKRTYCSEMSLISCNVAHPNVQINLAGPIACPAVDKPPLNSTPLTVLGSSLDCPLIPELPPFSY